ncbi:MAG: GYDIA family GHMP kinase [Robiginitalea sp.]
MKTFYSHGKLLLSGEYLVLDGATALALPTRPGQSLKVRDSKTEGLEWRSLNPDGTPWFNTRFTPKELAAPYPKGKLPEDIRGRLQLLIDATVRLNPQFAEELQNTTVETQLEFPRDWGLGSSSTLISNLAFWAGIDPYTLLQKTFGGSGYDIAAARQKNPFFYRLDSDGTPVVEEAAFDPPFASELFFVYLNQKQDSRSGIARYRNRSVDPETAVARVSGLTTQLVSAPTLASFCELLDEHEAFIAGILQTPTVKELRFPDFPGSVKSLGAWGGDFVLATGPETHQEYFRKQGFRVLKPYQELIL